MTDEQRKRIHDITYSCDDRAELAERIVALEAENAKMRELVSDMWTCIDEGEWDCSACPRHDGCDEGVSEFVRRMHELGIEAEDD